MSAWLYVLVWAAALVDQLGGVRAAGAVAGAALLGFLLLEFRRQGLHVRVLFIALMAVALVGVAGSAHPLALLLASGRRAAQYAAFFLALGVLRDAAETSPLVQRCGRHLVAQPAGVRYAALTAGGHLFGIILSYGAIELLGAMVGRANRASDDDEAARLRGRRMLMAIFRGFATMNCWSPLNVMTAVVSTAVPGAPMRLLLPLGFVTAMAMLGLGWAEDQMVARTPSARDAPAPSDERWTVHLGLVGLVVLVTLVAELTSGFAAIPLVASVTLTVPVIGFAWIAVEAARLGKPVARTLADRVLRFAQRSPQFRSEAAVLGVSGFTGVALAGVLPTGGLGPLVGGLPPIAVPLLVPVLLIATGQLGLNPIAVVAVLGAALPDPRGLGVPPAVLAFACMLGWGLGIGATPMSASAITTARWARVSPWTVATVWNAGFTASTLLLAWVATLGLWALWPR